MRKSNRKSESGFTLIEAIVVIAITGIVGAVVAIFIRSPVDGYIDSVNRAELTDEADTALRRMARDVRLALPNSIRVNNTGQFVEFLPTSTGGRYLDVQDDPNGNFLSFTNGADATFVNVGPALPITVGSHIVVFNLGQGMAPADAYAGGNRAQVSAVDGNLITMASNPFAGNDVLQSPSRRFQVVPPTAPVSYGCANGQLRRYWGYGISATQAAPPTGGQMAVLATGVAACAFSYQVGGHEPYQLVGLRLDLARNGENVALFHQVHVSNTP
jgi:MSHA biogenesis protein MshO